MPEKIGDSDNDKTLVLNAQQQKVLTGADELEKQLNKLAADVYRIETDLDKEKKHSAELEAKIAELQTKISDGKAEEKPQADPTEQIANIRQLVADQLARLKETMEEMDVAMKTIQQKVEDQAKQIAAGSASSTAAPPSNGESEKKIQDLEVKLTLMTQEFDKSRSELKGSIVKLAEHVDGFRSFGEQAYQSIVTFEARMEQIQKYLDTHNGNA